MSLTDSLETYTFGTSKDLTSEKQGIKYNNIIKQYKWWTLIATSYWTSIIRIHPKSIIFPECSYLEAQDLEKQIHYLI